MSELPKGWVGSTIGEACLIENGLRKPISLKERAGCQGDFPYYGATGVIDYLNSYTHEGEYVLIGEDGANLLSKSKPLAFIANGRYWVNNHAHTLRCLADSPNLYLEKYFNSLSLESWVTGSAQPKLTKKNLESIPYPLAPLAEQKRIVEKLDEVLAQVDTIKSRLDGIPALLKRFRQSVLASAVSGKLTEEWRGENQNALDTVEIVSTVSKERKARGFKAPRNVEDVTDVPFSIPDYWAWLRAGDLCLKITDGAHNTPKLVESGFPYLMAKDLTGGQLDFSENRLISEKDHRELYNKCQPEIGDLLVVNIGAGTGNNVLVNVDYEFSFKNIAILKRSTHVLPSYFKYFFDSQKKRIFDEQTRGGAQPFLSLTILNNLLIALPSIEEQKEIVRLVDEYFAFADTIEAQVKKAQARVDNLTQSILAKAFRGELVAQDPNDEPADKLLERIAEARKEAEALAKAAKKAEAAKKRAAKSA
ncbi:restriction endonuclease subunit S [Vibrio owensii]|uniref:restriction endonuclease subunit S n=1 Tax=Vibrio owensii TaxID=696485 RepID=UPI00215BFF62|nr:restriction endonuclease subunit S [Vibrio owensii]MCR9940976.1 restriction endonuclease subunit S [Vibrio owensii]